VYKAVRKGDCTTTASILYGWVRATKTLFSAAVLLMARPDPSSEPSSGTPMAADVCQLLQQHRELMLANCLPLQLMGVCLR
jgi:hypothetical protein